MERVWFKAKTYGWGWTPATWQGWMVILIYAAAIGASAFLFLLHKTTPLGLAWYFTFIEIVTAALITICYKTGERPGWRWGKRKD